VLVELPPPLPPIVDAPPVPQPDYVPLLAIARPTLPAPVRAMIDAATTSGDASTVAAVVSMARQTNPGFIAEIDQLNDAYNGHVRAQREAAEHAARERLAAANILDLWKGQVELGGSRATGNTDSLGLYGALGLTRDGLNWRHKLNARADLQKTNGVTTTERINASWQPNYKFDARLYAYGLAQYEHDRFLGFENRYTVGGGLGYRVVAKPKMTIDLEGGPAVRHTDFTDESPETAIAGRASVQMKWTLSPTLQFAQDTAIYLETGNNNVVSTTSLDTRLIGALKMRLSYNIQYERDAPAGSKSLDTLSRATLVYGF